MNRKDIEWTITVLEEMYDIEQKDWTQSGGGDNREALSDHGRALRNSIEIIKQTGAEP
jgi:hypothetical protein